MVTKEKEGIWISIIDWTNLFLHHNAIILTIIIKMHFSLRSYFKSRNFLATSLPVDLKPCIGHSSFFFLLKKNIDHVGTDTSCNSKHAKTNDRLFWNLKHKLTSMILCQLLFMFFHCWFSNWYYWSISEFFNRRQFHEVSWIFYLYCSRHWKINNKVLA